MKKILLLLSLISLTVFAEGIPFKPKTDVMELGRGANGDDKELIFNIGDGGSNPKMFVNDITKLFELNVGLDVTGPGIFSGNVSGVNGTFTGNGDFSGADLKVGPGTNTEQFMSFKISGEEVGFKFDPVTGEVLQKKKAGDAYKKLGTGSGSGSSGINGFGEDDNANAEDGTASWSNTGGTFIAFDNTAPNEKKVIEGEQSFRFTPSAQNDEVVGPTLNFDFTKFHGRTCELGIEYTGADDNLELHVVDANGDILNEDLPNNRKIPARTQTTGPFSVSFQCPTATAIAGDANKGSLHVEIVNVGAVAATAIDWDLTYMGTDRNLGTSDLPSDFSFRLDTGAGTISRNDGGVVSSCSNNATGDSSCTFVGLDNPPEVVCTTEAVNVTVGYTVGSLTNTGIRIQSTLSANQSGINIWVSCIGKKTGSDRNKTVNTYKASPVTSETVNSFTADINGALTITNETPEFITSCVSNGTGDKTCTFNAGLFTNAPTVQLTMFDGNGNCREARTSDISTTSFRYQTLSSGGVVADCRVSVEVNRTLTDYKKPQSKNLSLAGILVSKFAELSQNQLTVNICQVSPSGVFEYETCASWIDNILKGGTGNYDITAKAGVFAAAPWCMADYTGDDFANLDARALATTSTAIGVTTKIEGSNTYNDARFSIICIGRK